ncbi:MAG TPA: hypothetical protein VF529_14280 [Solirubrobacteraceae bacterium]|jgi:hypothetical protein
MRSGGHSASRSLADRSIAETLGGLVEREVSAYRRRLGQRDDAAAAEVLAALHASRELKAELATIVDRLERLAHGRNQREPERWRPDPSPTLRDPGGVQREHQAPHDPPAALTTRA